MKLFLFKHWKAILSITFIFVLTCLLSFTVYIHNIFHKPIKSDGEKETTIILVPRGSTFDKVTAIIREKGMLPHPRLYDYLAKKLRAHSRIQSGEFEINHSWNTQKLLKFLISGKSILHRITIPEGINFYEIANRLHKSNLASKETILSLKEDPDLIKKTGVPEAKSLEGFLFPETYFFSRAETERQILSTMIRQYRKVFNNQFRKLLKKLAHLVSLC